MVDLTCKYCGKDLKHASNGLMASGLCNCYSSLDKKHVALANPPFCVFCGGETKSNAGKLSVSGTYRCPASPSGSHQLDD